ncbi:MAG: alpha/beta fold hydrolase [Anaerolineae bacterium]|nr:alpha/beta fold hydrolase [Anaerolineae bacterium]
MYYRRYPALSNTVLIMLHGSSWHSRYFMPLAQSISAANAAQVYTPDLRGHGVHPVRRGDVDYIGQYEDDLADLMAVIRKDNPGVRFVIGGHSSGGGLAIRFAGGKYGGQASAYLLLAPFLHFMAPTFRFDTDWANPRVARLLGLIALNTIGIRHFNDLPVFSLNVPQEARDGVETLSYSYRLYVSYSPRNYRNDLRAIRQPLLLIAGTADEIFRAEQYEPLVAQCASAQVKLLDGVSHMGLVMAPELGMIVNTWMQGCITG